MCRNSCWFPVQEALAVTPQTALFPAQILSRAGWGRGWHACVSWPHASTNLINSREATSCGVGVLHRDALTHPLESGCDCDWKV